MSPEDSRGRWWEIHGEGQPDEVGYRELVADSRGRSRPERSLSVGADLADEPRHPARAFLWPVVSVVAAVGLILSVIYVSKDTPTSPASATPAQSVPQSSAPEAPAPLPDRETKRSTSSAQSGNPPEVGGRALTTGDRADTLRDRSAPQGSPADTPESPFGAPSGSPGGAAGDTGNQSTEPRTLREDASTDAAFPLGRRFMLEEGGSAPAAPGAQQSRREVLGTGGCRFSDTSGYYDCTIAHKAPLYWAGTNESYNSATGRRRFLCQSAGSGYSVGDRGNYWWAWLQASGAWVPVVFLEGGPDNAPQPGLPVCDSASTTKKAPTNNPSAEPTTTSIVDRQTEHCLDSNDKGRVYTEKCDSSDNQKWNEFGDGTIRDKQTEHCLDSDYESRVYTEKCDGSDNQKWDNPGEGTIRDKQTGRCLDSNDEGKVHTVTCDESDNQKWNKK